MIDASLLAQAQSHHLTLAQRAFVLALRDFRDCMSNKICHCVFGDDTQGCEVAGPNSLNDVEAT
jgi:hypothetical protein